MCAEKSIKLNNDIIIDGVTEIDDLTLVTHIANTEYNRINEIQKIKEKRIKQSHINLHEYLNDDDESDSDLEELINNLDTNTQNTVFNDVKDPLDNLRIIHTLNLPNTVDASLPIDKIGKCTSIIDNIIIVKSDKADKILDLGSITCKLDRTMLGTVNDTFGQTDSPYYMIVTKYNTPPIEIGQDVYYDVRHSTFITDYKCTDLNDEDNSDLDEEVNSIKKPNTLEQSYQDLTIVER